MPTQPPTDEAGATELRKAAIKARVRRAATIILPIALLVMVFAQWMAARERQARLEELQARISKLQTEIDKIRPQMGGNNMQRKP
jgi:hypothetical protein